MSRDRSKNKSESWDASWDQSSTRLLKTTLQATPAQRLAWLEEAIALAYESGALPEPSRSAGRTS